MEWWLCQGEYGELPNKNSKTFYGKQIDIGHYRAARRCVFNVFFIRLCICQITNMSHTHLISVEIVL